MPTYRTYCFDGIRQIRSADELFADDDAEAVAKTKVQHRGALKCEIWQQNRLVAALDAKDLAADPG